MKMKHVLRAKHLLNKVESGRVLRGPCICKDMKMKHEPNRCFIH
uniref:Uncharacterized protein n=1 Tax=Rhizophora mucronata TaxID=61149 RepID=A0A2P2Q0H9_RHIMU